MAEQDTTPPTIVSVAVSNSTEVVGKHYTNRDNVTLTVDLSDNVTTDFANALTNLSVLKGDSVSVFDVSNVSVSGKPNNS